jgi:cell division protein FtsA
MCQVKKLHVLPQEFKIDGQAEIKEPIGMFGSRLNWIFTLSLKRRF